MTHLDTLHNTVSQLSRTRAEVIASITENYAIVLDVLTRHNDDVARQYLKSVDQDCFDLLDMLVADENLDAAKGKEKGLFLETLSGQQEQNR